jgi:hypothetical protein
MCVDAANRVRCCRLPLGNGILAEWVALRARALWPWLPVPLLQSSLATRQLALSFGTTVWVDALIRSDPIRSELVFVETLLLGFVAFGAVGSAKRIRNRAGLPNRGIVGGGRGAE